MSPIRGGGNLILIFKTVQCSYLEQHIDQRNLINESYLTFIRSQMREIVCVIYLY